MRYRSKRKIVGSIRRSALESRARSYGVPMLALRLNRPYATVNQKLNGLMGLFEDEADEIERILKKQGA